jgi:hypothetical protein
MALPRHVDPACPASGVRVEVLRQLCQLLLGGAGDHQLAVLHMDLTVRDLHQLAVDAKKPTDRQHGTIHRLAIADQQIVDAADLLVLVVVHGGADHLAGPQLVAGGDIGGLRDAGAGRAAGVAARYGWQAQRRRHLVRYRRVGSRPLDWRGLRRGGGLCHHHRRCGQNTSDGNHAEYGSGRFHVHLLLRSKQIDRTRCILSI